MKAIFAVLLVLVLCVGCGKKDFKSLKALAEKGDAKAQYSLGDKYVTGRGVEKDDKEAVKWYRKAAEQNHAAALNNSTPSENLAAALTFLGLALPEDGINAPPAEVLQWAVEHWDCDRIPMQREIIVAASESTYHRPFIFCGI